MLIDRGFPCTFWKSRVCSLRLHWILHNAITFTMIWTWGLWSKLIIMRSSAWVWRSSATLIAYSHQTKKHSVFFLHTMQNLSLFLEMLNNRYSTNNRLTMDYAHECHIAIKEEADDGLHSMRPQMWHHWLQFATNSKMPWEPVQSIQMAH